MRSSVKKLKRIICLQKLSMPIISLSKSFFRCSMERDQRVIPGTRYVLFSKKAKYTLPAAQRITNIDQRTGTVTVELDGKSVNLDIRKTVPQNAQEYYERVKKFSKKSEGAIKAIENTRKASGKKD